MISDLQFIISHCVRSVYKFKLMWCANARCLHCSSLPVEETQFVQFLRMNGGRFPDPIISNVRPPTFAHSKWHYETLREFLGHGLTRDKILLIDHDLPSRIETVFGQCTSGCRYVFLSAADKKRHNALVHGKWRETLQSKNKKRRK